MWWVANDQARLDLICVRRQACNGLQVRVRKFRSASMLIMVEVIPTDSAPSPATSRKNASNAITCNLMAMSLGFSMETIRQIALLSLLPVWPMAPAQLDHSGLRTPFQLVEDLLVAHPVGPSMFHSGTT